MLTPSANQIAPRTSYTILPFPLPVIILQADTTEFSYEFPLLCRSMDSHLRIYNLNGQYKTCCTVRSAYTTHRRENDRLNSSAPSINQRPKSSVRYNWFSEIATALLESCTFSRHLNRFQSPSCSQWYLSSYIHIRSDVGITLDRSLPVTLRPFRSLKNFVW